MSVDGSIADVMRLEVVGSIARSNKCGSGTRINAPTVAAAPCGA